jgi:hypothetical protein
LLGVQQTTEQKGRELDAPPLEAPRSALEEDAIKPRPMGACSTRSLPNENSRFPSETVAISYAKLFCFGFPYIRFFGTLTIEASRHHIRKAILCAPAIRAAVQKLARVKIDLGVQFVRKIPALVRPSPCC